MEMDVNITFRNDKGCDLSLEDCEEKTHVRLSLYTGDESLEIEVSIEELKHALRKIACK